MFRRVLACALPLGIFVAAMSVPAGAGTDPSPQDMLRGLYAQYDVHAHGHQPRHIDAKALMTPQLARAYARVTHAEAGDVALLDWDVFVNAQDKTQDYDVQHLNLTVTPAGKTEMVTADFDNLGQPATVIYAFTHTPAGWRIDDIRYPPDRIYPKGFSLEAFARRAN